jgi:gamma-glutamylcyclotransferase (GGCT)/AIG2-like uncharacterized protein YtfP
MKIFVYGTLLRGEANHHFLQGAEFWGIDRLANAQLFDLGEYPMILPGAGIVQGEIYLVNEEILMKLDVLEEHPIVYCRTHVTLQSGTAAQVYWGRPQYVSGFPGITGGDWRQRNVNSSQIHED